MQLKTAILAKRRWKKLLQKNKNPHATRLTHGETGTRLYNIWSSMKQRVKNPNAINYKIYGGNGIFLCPEWDIHENFREWALQNGYSDNLSIDRIDGTKGYFPDNCRWVTMKVQQNNRCNNHIITFQGKTMTLSLWANSIGIPVKTLSRRIVDKKWSIERALTTPLQTSKSHKHIQKEGAK